MSVYKHYDNSNQVASFYKLPVIFQIIKVFCKNYFNALIFNLFIL
jgi:hypothetical protein